MKEKRLLSESGAVLLLFVISLPALVGLATLAVDVGYMYTSQGRLNKASRAAAATALNMVAFRGWGAMVADAGDSRDPNLGYKTANAVASLGKTPYPVENPTNTEVLQQVAASVDTSMKLYFPGDFQTSTATGASTSATETGNSNLRFLNDRTQAWENSPPSTIFNMKDSSVTLKMRYAVPTFALCKMLELVGNNVCTIDDTGKSRFPIVTSIDKSGYLKPANIFVLLDTSGSMNSSAGSGLRKIDVLKQAVSSFIDMFNPLKDKIAIIPFATTVKGAADKKLSNFASTTDGEFLDIKKQAQGYQAGGQTNPCDALLETISAVNKSGLSKYESKFVVLFTDGAPNVYRLGFADPSDSTQDAPKLVQAMSAVEGTDASKGWYGWTVKWGERELSSCPAPPSGATALTRNCDPFFGIPQVKDNDGVAISANDIKSRLKLNEDGQFVWLRTPTDPTPIKDIGFSLQFKTKPVHEDNYKWYGPSYLVHGGFQIPEGLSLIDRIPPSVATPNLVTCGPGSKPGMPGSQQRGFRDMYNHAYYFASRVINSKWHLSSGPGAVIRRLDKTSSKEIDDSEDEDNTKITAPGYFASAQPIQDGDSSDPAPGCLSSLNAYLPGNKDAKIFVGENNNTNNLNPSIVSNADAGSISRVGEIVKTAELPYYCAIRAADLLRQNSNVTIYVIGLGPSANSKYGSSCNDPMQNALDFESRKDGFLRRLAFAPEALSQPANFIRGQGDTWDLKSDFRYQRDAEIKCVGEEQHPLNGERIRLGYSDNPIEQTPRSPNPESSKGFTPENLGAYYGSNDPSQLRGLFGNVAKTVLLRLAG